MQTQTLGVARALVYLQHRLLLLNVYFLILEEVRNMRMKFWRYDLSSSTSGVYLLGQAILEGICTLSYSNSINEDQAQYRSALTCTHELGHKYVFIHFNLEYFYRPQRSCGKVMFLHVSVIQCTGEVWQTPPWANPPCQTPSLGKHPPWETPPPPSDGHCSGRYASYWNVFLFYLCIKDSIRIKD